MSAYDLLIRGGTVIDPAAGLHAQRDVALANGKVAVVQESIAEEDAASTLDARGKLVVPGLIDLHTHVFTSLADGADVERDCLARGTTSLLDAGSTGSRAFPAFKKYVVERSRARIQAWLNISSIGLIDTRVGELLNLHYVDVDQAVQMVEANRDTIIGFKIRVSSYVAGLTCLPALRLVRQAADATKLPIMVHIGESGEPLPTILEYLRPGDVVTHSLTGRRQGILSTDGTLLPAVREARERGILFDSAHGRMHWGFELIRRVIDQGFLPDTISTDITQPSASDPSFHLPQIMSKLMALGVSLDQAVSMATASSTRYLQRIGALQTTPDGAPLGTLQPGAVGDVAILERLEGEFTLRDNEGQTVRTRQRLRPWRTVVGGREVIEASPEA